MKTIKFISILTFIFINSLFFHKVEGKILSEKNTFTDTFFLIPFELQNDERDTTNNLCFVDKDFNYLYPIYNMDSVFSAIPPSPIGGNKRAEAYKASIKLNALLVTGTVSPAIEFRLSNNLSFQFTFVGTYCPNGFLWTNKPIRLYSGFLDVKYYPVETFKGFFMGINAGIGLYNMSRAIIPNHWNEEYNNVMHKGWNVMGGVTLGWTFPISTRLGIEPFLSTGYTHAQYDNYVDNELVSPNKTQQDLIIAYNGGVNIVYKILPVRYSFINNNPKTYIGSKYNRSIYRRFNKVTRKRY